MAEMTAKEISDACEAADRDTILDKLRDGRWDALSKESFYHTGFDVGFKAGVAWTASRLAAPPADAKPRGPSKEWLAAAGDAEDATRSVSVGGLAADRGLLAAPPATPPHDPVNRPAHYTSHPSGVEAIQVIEHYPANIAMAMKYLWRCDLKGAPVQDLEKARWYVDREIKRRNGGGK